MQVMFMRDWKSEENKREKHCLLALMGHTAETLTIYGIIFVLFSYIVSADFVPSAKLQAFPLRQVLSPGNQFSIKLFIVINYLLSFISIFNYDQATHFNQKYWFDCMVIYIINIFKGSTSCWHT